MSSGAASLGINRSTVYRAYQDLWAQGYLEARPGAYSTVRARLRKPSCLDFERLSAPPPRRLFSQVGRMAQLAAMADDLRLINFASLAAELSMRAPARPTMNAAIAGH